MPLETVRIAFLKDAVIPEFVDGVTVRVFNALGEFVSMAASGENVPGIVEFELLGDATPFEYQLRFYKKGASITPKRIQVFSPADLAPTGTNEFTITADVFDLEPSPDPMMCRCSGFITGPTGRAKKTLTLSFLPKFNAFVVERAAALTGRFTLRTDANGYVSVDLYRFGMYEVTIEGREAVVRNIEIPDRSKVQLSHLLFPVVTSVVYAEPLPFTLARNTSLTLTPHVQTSDFRALGVGEQDVLYEVEDPSIASVQVSGDHIVVRGLRAGSTKLRVTRADNSIVYVPDLGITGGEVPLVVTT
jgi:hypothetical protein